MLEARSSVLQQRRFPRLPSSNLFVGNQKLHTSVYLSVFVQIYNAGAGFQWMPLNWNTWSWKETKRWFCFLNLI